MSDSSQITANLGSQLITVGVAVLGGALALLTFFAENRTELGWFYLLTAIAAALAVVSILFGGWGIDAIAGERPAGTSFNAQAMLLASALLCLAAAVLVANVTSVPVESASDRQRLEAEQRLTERSEALQHRVNQLERELLQTDVRIARLERAVTRLGGERLP